MIAQWNSSLSVLPVAWVQFPAQRSISRDFPWLITLCQPVLSQRGRKWFNPPSMTQHNLRTTRRKAEVQPCIDDSWKKKTKYYTKLILIFGLVLCTEAPVMHIES